MARQPVLAPVSAEVASPVPGAGFYKDLVDKLFEGVYFVDLERRIAYWNRGAERITGYPADQVLGSRCADNLLVHVDEAGRALCREGCPLEATCLDGRRHRLDGSDPGLARRDLRSRDGPSRRPDVPKQEGRPQPGRDGPSSGGPTAPGHRRAFLRP